MNFLHKNYLDLSYISCGGAGSFFSWKMANFVARTAGVVNVKNC